jgi:hypothetical protein
MDPEFGTGGLHMTFASVTADHSSHRALSKRILSGRIVMPIIGAIELRVLLKVRHDHLPRSSLSIVGRRRDLQQSRSTPKLFSKIRRYRRAEQSFRVCERIAGFDRRLKSVSFQRTAPAPRSREHSSCFFRSNREAEQIETKVIAKSPMLREGGRPSRYQPFVQRAGEGPPIKRGPKPLGNKAMAGSGRPAASHPPTRATAQPSSPSR